MNTGLSQPASSALDFMQLNNKEFQNKFFILLDSVRNFQHPPNDKEKEMMVDLNQKLLNQFLKDIDTKEFSKNNTFEKEYHFNIAPKNYSDPADCKDKISVQYFPGKGYRVVIFNTFLVEPNWCTEHTVVYGFEIKGNRIINFGRNEAG